MSTRHLSIKVGEHLGFHLKTEGSVKDPFLSCDICANSKFNVICLRQSKNVSLILKLRFTKLYYSKNITLDLIDNYLHRFC